MSPESDESLARLIGGSQPGEIDMPINGTDPERIEAIYEDTERGFNDLLTKKLFDFFRGGPIKIKSYESIEHAYGYSGLKSTSSEDDIIKRVMGDAAKWKELPDYETLDKNWRIGRLRRGSGVRFDMAKKWPLYEQIPYVWSVVTYYSSKYMDDRLSKEFKIQMKWIDSFKEIYPVVLTGAEKISRHPRLDKDLKKPLEKSEWKDLVDPVINKYNKLIGDIQRYYKDVRKIPRDCYVEVGETDKITPGQSGDAFPSRHTDSVDHVNETFINALHYNMSRFLGRDKQGKEAFDYLVKKKQGDELHNLLDDFIGKRNAPNSMTNKYKRAIEDATLKLPNAENLKDTVTAFRAKLNATKDSVDEFARYVKYLNELFAPREGGLIYDEDDLRDVLERVKRYDGNELSEDQIEWILKKLNRYYDIVFKPWYELAAAYRIMVVLLEKYVSYLELLANQTTD